MEPKADDLSAFGNGLPPGIRPLSDVLLKLVLGVCVGVPLLPLIAVVADETPDVPEELEELAEGRLVPLPRAVKLPGCTAAIRGAGYAIGVCVITGFHSGGASVGRR